MKKTRSKSRAQTKTRAAVKSVTQRVPYQKPALRSDAFAKALSDAKSCVNDRESLQALFNEAAVKAAAVPREPFKESWPYLQTMLRLVRAHHRGEYEKASHDNPLWIITDLNNKIEKLN